MIDEDLYQQAADELNSNKRRPALWARACALASDDHDEARYLYTNLRVEELLAEQAEATPEVHEVTETDPTLALTPVGEQAINRVNNPPADELITDKDLPEISDDAPSSFTAPSGVDKKESNDDFLQLAPLEQASGDDESDPTDKDGSAELSATSQSALAGETPDPDADLMADYVPEHIPDEDPLEDPLEDTYTDDGLIEEGFQAELENFKAEENADPLTSDLDLESTTRIAADKSDISPEIVDALFNPEDTVDADADGETEQDQTAELTSAFLVEDLTQANMDVLEAHTTELDDMLEDAHYQPPEEVAPDTDMEWLDNDIESTEAEAAVEHEPVVYEEDSFTDELTRQADELEDDIADKTTDFSQQTTTDEFAEDAFSSDSQHLPEATAVGAVAGAAAMAAAGGDAHAPDTDENLVHDQALTEQAATQPLDLTQGRKGKLFRVFNRNGETMAVKKGVSWSALFFTLPVLLYRKLFGTALAYVLLWCVSISGLALCALAWRDAGTAVTPYVQAGTIGFALLAFIGLIYLPFRHANTWRSEKLENTGFELVAITKAKNADLAIARARRHATELA